MNQKKIAVIILGAGATYPWDGPSNSDIETTLFNDSKFLRKGSSENLAQYIKNLLVAFYKCEPSEINFEFIMNSLETISDYHYDNAYPSAKFTGSRPLWFSLREEIIRELENIDFKAATSEPGFGYLYNLSNPSNDMGLFHEGNVERFYLSFCIKNYLYLIRWMIHAYNRQTTHKRYDTVNQNLFDYCSFLKSKGYTLRFYTTNYDTLIPNILTDKYKLEIYNGFDTNGVNFVPNIKRILTDRFVDCYYNLHGSIYWKMNPYTQVNNTMHHEVTFNYLAGIVCDDSGTYADYTNTGEFTSQHNIVTGFNKFQKVSFEPLKSFSTALANDCINADLISTIGYSYGDNHINRIIKHGIIYNNSKFIHITFGNNFFGTTEAVMVQDFALKRQGHLDFEKLANYYVNKNKDAVIYTSGFEQFLQNKIWGGIDFLF